MQSARPDVMIENVGPCEGRPEGSASSSMATELVASVGLTNHSARMMLAGIAEAACAHSRAVGLVLAGPAMATGAARHATKAAKSKFRKFSMQLTSHSGWSQKPRRAGSRRLITLCRALQVDMSRVGPIG